MIDCTSVWDSLDQSNIYEASKIVLLATFVTKTKSGNSHGSNIRLDKYFDPSSLQQFGKANLKFYNDAFDTTFLIPVINTPL